MMFHAVPIFVMIVGSPQNAQISAPPLQFVENCGQWDASVAFAARCRDGAVRIEHRAVSFVARSGPSVKLCFEGAREDVVLDPRDAVRTVYSFFLGNDPQRWRGGVPAHRRLRAVGLYDGVDIEYREDAEGGGLEYDIILDDPGRLDQLVIRCEGAIGLESEPDGALRIRTERGDIRQSPPHTWQVGADGAKRSVDCRYRMIDGRRYGFELNFFDPLLPLVIDPAVGVFTFVGGGGNDRTIAVAHGPDSDVYVAGMTGDALAFTVPPQNCATVEGDPTGGRNALVARYSTQGELQAVAVLGGIQDDEATALHIDAKLGVSVCGYTSSDNFPATNDSTYHGGAGVLIPGDGFVARLSLDLCSLSYSTFLGGSQRDGSQGVGVNSRGQIAVLGFTASFDFPSIPGAFQETYQGGSFDSTLSILDPMGGPALVDQLVYSTFLGGGGSDAWDGTTDPENDLNIYLTIGGLAIDAEGRVAIAGLTRSPNFPTTPGAFQSHVVGGLDAWVAIMIPDIDRPAEEQLVWSTLIGGVNFEGASGLALGPDGGVWIAGQTFSAFPTTLDAFQPATTGSSDAFLAHFDPVLVGNDQLVYSTLLGGNQWEYANDVSVSASGIAAVVGDCNSSFLFPTQGALQETFGGSWDGFLVVLDPSRNPDGQLRYSTFVGGGSIDGGWAVSFDGATVWLTSETWSFEFIPFPGVTSPVGRDGYLLGLDLRFPIADFTHRPVEGGRIAFDASASKPFPGTTISSYAWDFGDGATAGDVLAEHLYTDPGRYIVTLVITSDGGLTAQAEQLIEIHCPSGPVDSFTALDIGDPDFAGATRLDGAGISICAGGKRLAGTGDRFHFVHRRIDCDDFTFTAKIASATAGNDIAEVGLMVREGLEPGARHAALVLERLATADGSRARFAFRSTTSGATTTPSAPSPLVPPNAWLRVERHGDLLLAAVSIDGMTWVEEPLLPVNLAALSPTVYVGFAGMGAESLIVATAFQPVRATFAEVRLEACDPVITFRRGEINGDDQLDLSDVIVLLGYLFLGETAPPCLEAGDIDDSGELDITDPIALLAYHFLGGKAPPVPFAACGVDPTPDGIGCGGGSCR